MDLVDLDAGVVLGSVRTILARLVQPPVSVAKYRSTMVGNRLPQFADFLGSALSES